MTERILTQAQASEMGFLRRVHGVTQRRAEIRWRPGQEARPFRSKCRLLYWRAMCFGRKCTVL